MLVAPHADGLHWRELEGASSLPCGDKANLGHDVERGLYFTTLKEGEMGPY